MSFFDSELRLSTRRLPGDLRLWMRRALDSGWFEIGPGDYDGGPGGTVCPITAAAKLAGAWDGEGIRAGWEAWGTPDAPSDSVEDFAAYFDLYCGERGLEGAVSLLEATLLETDEEKRAA